MGDIDLEQIARDAAGFRGRFAAAPSYRDNYAEGEMALTYTSDGGDETTEVATNIDGEHIAAPLARMLNAVPALLAEVERLRNLGSSACRLVTESPGSPWFPQNRVKAKELLAQINRRPSREVTNG